MNTIKVLYKKHGNVEVTINESDFDPEQHERVDAKAKKAPAQVADPATDDATGKGATSKPPKK
jgi:hypothetical protein